MAAQMLQRRGVAYSVPGRLHLSIWVLRVSPITRAGIKFCLVDTFWIGFVMISAVAVLCQMLDLSLWAEGGLTLTLIIVLTLARGMERADIRADISKLIWRNK